MNIFDFAVAGYGSRGLFNSRTVSLNDRHELQYEHYSDDWDEEDDANGWRPAGGTHYVR